MLDEILASAQPGAVCTAPALLAGEWRSDGPLVERIGPHRREVVSRARVAATGEVGVAAQYAHAARARMARLAPAARAEILDRAATLAQEHAEPIARLIALELGKPVKDGRGELERVAD